MLHFIETTTGGLPQKRKQCARACEPCRKRKKRCDHLLSSGAALPSPSSTCMVTGQSGEEPGTPSPSPTRDDHITHITTGGPLSPQSHVGDSAERFYVGNMNPESTFLAGASPSTSHSTIDQDRLGVWLSRRPESCPTRPSQPSCIYSQDPLISKLFLPYLEQHFLSLLPSRSDFDGLRAIYMRDIHPIFPVLDTKGFETLPAHSPAKSLLAQAICLAASATWGENQYLKLSTSPEKGLRPNEFAQQISMAILATINLGVIKDKLVLVQVLSLLSLFNQLSDDRHFSADLTARAVTYVQTLGLHLHNNAEHEGSAYMTRLFCCVWALDRLNSAFHGRPTLIHEQDASHNLDSCINEQDPCLRLFLRIVMLLDKAINLYRPENGETKTEPSNDDIFPSFEDLVYNCGAHSVSARSVACIETLYHAVAILSCRSQYSQESPCSSAAYVRQTLSAGRVAAIVCEDLHEHMSLIPIVPYAISISLRVFYRDLRLSKAKIFRMRARKQLMVSCDILRKLGNIFASATIMADLVEDTIREADRHHESALALQEPGSEQGRTETGQASHGSHPETQNPLAVVDEGGSRSGLDTWRTSRAHSVDDRLLDPSIFETMPDLDIFAHFAPEFDFDGFDASLGDGLSS